MLKTCNRLLIVMVLALGVCALGYSSSDAAIRASTGEPRSLSVSKPGAQLHGAGEPDIGDQKNNPNGEDENDDLVLGRSPNGYRWILMVWARHYLGVGW